MAVYIKGMEMPLNCTRCPCSDDGSRYCRAANEYIPMLGKPKFCPLVEIKGPHGRLIDSDALKETIAENVYPVADDFNSRDYGMFWTGGIEKAIDEQPTVIERSEDDRT